eukprot:TRINITY_DN10379_c0_g1_i3.p1 TRINITY_DN10379_c0_g1~~TRINITY_DN10379_c0_g1_i3.p1  ORF type:complete len:186 (+),score=12.81 TRINITY_DN10379_c0_g1_i3:215-772(+)
MNNQQVSSIKAVETPWNYTPHKSESRSQVVYATPDTAQSVKASFQQTHEVRSGKSFAKAGSAWGNLGQDIDHLKYELSLCMKKRMPKFDYDFTSSCDTEERSETLEIRTKEADDLKGTNKDWGRRSRGDLERDGVMNDPKFRGFVDRFGYKQALLFAGQFDKHCWNCFGKTMLSKVRLPIESWPK